MPGNQLENAYQQSRTEVFHPESQLPTTQRSNRWHPKYLVVALGTAAALTFLAACGSARGSDDQNLNRPPATSIAAPVAEPATLLPTPQREIAMCSAGSYQESRDLLPVNYRDELINIIKTIARPQLLENTVCREFFESGFAPSYNKSEPSYMSVSRLNILGTGRGQGDKTRIDRSQTNEQVQYTFLHTPRESQDPLLKIHDDNLARYASSKIQIPSDTIWEEPYSLPTGTRIQRGSSNTTTQKIFVQNNGEISVNIN